ncbi:MAG TPA: hypothetical protein VHK24_01855 [Steroidobacter sp.]|jgi:hypothetical protein|nr:hypothetical protein [Steroidobacter sp.]
MKWLYRFLGCAAVWSPAWASTAHSVSQTHRIVGTVIISGVWIMANICFAGMRAQNNPSTAWRFAAFVAGLPGTLMTYFFVDEGSERAYGVDIPKKR